MGEVRIFGQLRLRGPKARDAVEADTLTDSPLSLADACDEREAAQREGELRAALGEPVRRVRAAAALASVLRRRGKVFLAEVASGLAKVLQALEAGGAAEPIVVKDGALSLSHEEAVALLAIEADGDLDRLRTTYLIQIIDIEHRSRFSPMTRMECEHVALPLLRSGLLPQFLYTFDHAFYFYSNAEVRDEAASSSRLDCVLHFLARGLDAGLDVSQYEHLEPRFYAEAYGVAPPVEAALMLRHWLSEGLRLGHKPNRLLWARAEGLPHLRAIPDIDIVRSVAPFLPGSAQPDWATCFRHICSGGQFNVSQFNHLGWPEVHFLIMLADRQMISGRLNAGHVIYEHVYSRTPDNELAATRYADSLKSQGLVFAAQTIYERFVAGSSNIWAHVNLAECHEKLGRWERALEVLRATADRFGADPSAKRHLRLACERCLEAHWKQAANDFRFDKTAGVLTLERGCQLVWSALLPRSELPKRPIRRVALYANQDLEQCRFYRVTQKLEQIAAAGYEAVLFDHIRDHDDFVSQAASFDAVIFYRTHANFLNLHALATAVELGLHTIYEIDDLTFDPEQFPPPLSTYEGMVSEAEYADLQMGPALQRFMLDHCEHAIASTPALARAMATRAPSVFLHRNALGHAHYAALGAAPKADAEGPVIIFYGSGTRAHKSDFIDLVTPALERLLAPGSTPVVFVLAGAVALPEPLKAHPDKVVLLPEFQDVESFWRQLGCAHINLAPLVSTPVTDAKSEIKWLEAAMLGLPSVVGATETYRDVVEDGVTGRVCATSQAWSEALVSLVHSPEERARIGAAAKQAALERYSLDAMSRNIADIFKQVGPDLEDHRPRVVLVNVFYPPESIGGATRVLHDNVKDFVREHGEAFSVEVFAARSGELRSYSVLTHAWEGVRVTTVSTPDQPDIDQVYDDEQMEKAFDQFLETSQPAIIHFHCVQRLGVGLMRVAKRRGIPYLITFHDAWWMSHYQFLLDQEGRESLYCYSEPTRTLLEHGVRDFQRLEELRPALDGAARLLTVSEPFAEVCRRAGLTRTEAVPNGLPHLQPREPRLPRPQGKVVLGFVGGTALHKGFDLFKAAVHMHPLDNISVLVIDHGLSQGELLSERWGSVDVHFRGKTSQSDVNRLYAEIDVLVAPSIWPESFGLVAREARHFGCWVIASDRGDVGGDVLDGEDGFITPVSSPHALAEVLRRIDADPQRFSREPPARPAGRLSADQARDLAAIYRELI